MTTRLIRDASLNVEVVAGGYPLTLMYGGPSARRTTAVAAGLEGSSEHSRLRRARCKEGRAATKRHRHASCPRRKHQADGEGRGKQ
jgi:hypothetical protein